MVGCSNLSLLCVFFERTRKCSVKKTSDCLFFHPTGGPRSQSSIMSIPVL